MVRSAAAVEVPTLHMVAEDSVMGGDPYWDALKAPERTRVFLRGGMHNDFTDSCSAGVTLRCSTLVPAEVFRPMRVYTLGFLQRFLEGASGLEALLDGQATVSAAGYEVTAR